MADKKGSNELKTGIVALGAVVVLFLGFNFLKGNSLFNTDNEYYTYYENVEGLLPSAKVVINGYQVGKVSEIKMMPDKHFRVTMSVKDDYSVTKGSQAQLLSGDLLSGTKVITLISGASTETAPEGTILKGLPSAGILDNLSSNMSPMLSTVKHVVGNVDSLLLNLKEVVNEDARIHISNSMASLDGSMKQVEMLTTALNLQTKNLNAVMTNANKTMEYTSSFAANLDGNNARVNAILTNAESVTNQLSQAKIQQTIDNLEAVSNKLSAFVNTLDKKDGSLGLLINDPKLYNNLTQTLQDLGNLSADLKAHPGKYINISVFGSKQR